MLLLISFRSISWKEMIWPKSMDSLMRSSIPSGTRLTVGQSSEPHTDLFFSRIYLLFIYLFLAALGLSCGNPDPH